MEYTYQIVLDKITKTMGCLKRSDGWFIPFDPQNSDYQAYLLWLEEGNTPEPAEENQ